MGSAVNAAAMQPSAATHEVSMSISAVTRRLASELSIESCSWTTLVNLVAGRLGRTRVLLMVEAAFPIGSAGGTDGHGHPRLPTSCSFADGFNSR